ncbi:tetratricopeptide repeat protein [Pelagerythrobacter rhizovicinus]|uniref:Tetratricopeptide repeat protein n=1 Tax=Pelagerythrobacter rhizovicinus TaxID=2268576 RepID=A0A4Q2KG53_9SPHN|nr:tetratricopeptide repeat protein [Pelagerythrobacter rhizovicinus]
MRRNPGHTFIGAVVLAVLAGAGPAAAQNNRSVSRAVVQPLPPPSVSSLGEALRRLARDPRDVDALIGAGNASLELNDIEAAIGFFGRAQELSPENGRIKLGLAGAFVRSGRPIEALRLFEEAERAGVSTATLASERGLAYDLVGDNPSAQAQYRQALAGGQEDAEAVRRLAISQAIAGDREAFEKTLYPQLVDEDYAGFRARAFGLAILGEEEEAVAIAETVMPRDLSERIAPYLRYMRRLTKAQQAAAANLGVFPRAAQIGRDDPRIAQYAGSSPSNRGADARLAPAGEPLRSRGEGDDATGQSSPAPSAAGSGGELPSVAVNAARAVVSEPVVQPVPDQAPVQTASAGSAELEPTQPSEALEAAVEPARTLLAGSAPAPAPGFDLSAVASSATPGRNATAAPASVAEAFSGFELGPLPRSGRAAGAVDITLIEPPREVEEKPPAKPKPPAHPRRLWVQVATGRDLSAFRYDWRRISRKAPEILGDFKPMTTPWVEAHRLLAGPFDTEKAAQEAVSKLREAGLDSFLFTSEEGQEIVPLR